VGAFTVAYTFRSASTAGSWPLGPSASSTTVFRMPYRLIVAEPTSDSSGYVMPWRLLKSARVSCES